MVLMGPNGQTSADQAQRDVRTHTIRPKWRDTSSPAQEPVSRGLCSLCLRSTWFPHVDTCFPTGLYNKVLFSSEEL